MVVEQVDKMTSKEQQEYRHNTRGVARTFLSAGGGGVTLCHTVLHPGYLPDCLFEIHAMYFNEIDDDFFTFQTT